jgi:S-disulfanyl-L-cysteine oxidoreductase SoxD
MGRLRRYGQWVDAITRRAGIKRRAGILRLGVFAVPGTVLVLLISGSQRHGGGWAHGSGGISGWEAPADTTGGPASFGFGRMATPQEITAMDISIRPDGKGLPPGSGTAGEGKAIYAVKCAACHGKTGTEGPYARLVGPMGDTGDTTKAKTIGNYWPYATTIFDYTRRAMPFYAPGSLSDAEVYSLTAFLLAANKIIDSSAVVDAQSLPRVKMPAHDLFVPDDRRGGPEVR